MRIARAREALVSALMGSILAGSCGTASDMDESRAETGVEDLVDASEGNVDGGGSTSADEGGRTPYAPLSIRFWKDTDDRLVIYRYAMDRGDSGQYAQVVETNRFHMSAETLELLSLINEDTYPVDGLYEIDDPYGDLPEIVRASSGLVACLPEESSFDSFLVARSSGSIGDPTTIISSIACGPIDLFTRGELAGMADPTFLRGLFNSIR